MDGFKTVNDSLGHAAGDRLLVGGRRPAPVLPTTPGEMVARLGGDEFVALTTGPGTERTVDELAERITERAGHPDQHRRPRPHGARQPRHRGGPGRGTHRGRGAASADITMYRAKSAGGNRSRAGRPRRPTPARSPGTA
ncbi:GGDEF domain-containing protein [Streptomyces tricolor]|nr:GGDEF domain-containing protein [Streptomyces tricolor]